MSIKRESIEKKISLFMPLLILLVLVILFGVFTDGRFFETSNLQAILNQTVIVAIVTTGATFIFSSGSFDVAMGYSCAVSAILATMAYQRTGSRHFWIIVVVALVSGVLIESFNSILSVIFGLPVFFVTIAMMSVLSALQAKLLDGQVFKVISEATKNFEAGNAKYIIFVLFFLVCMLIFQFTRVGRSMKLLGDNRTCAEQTGIRPALYTFLSFGIAGIGVGLGAVLTITRSGSISMNTCSTLGTDVMIAIVLGGMPITGGSKSHIFSGVIGAVTVVVLNIGLTMLRVDNEVIQAVRGIVFLVMVFLTTKRTQLLPN